MSMFSRAHQALLGADVGLSSIKLVELRRVGGRYVVAHCAVEPLRKDWVLDSGIAQMDEVVQALRRAVKRSGTQLDQVALALPASAVITRRIVLPLALTEQERELQVELEAAHYIPYPLEDVSLDFCPTHSTQLANGDQELMIVAARRDRLQQCIDLAQGAGLRPVVVEVQPHAAGLALSRLMAQSYAATERVALFEINTASTRLSVVCDSELLYEREQALGAAQLLERLAEDGAYGYEQAQHLLHAAVWPKTAEPRVVAPFCLSLAQDLSRMLEFCLSSAAVDRVDSILLAGGGALLPGLDIAVAQACARPCQRVRPFEGMRWGEGLEIERWHQQQALLLTATGLALRGFVRSSAAFSSTYALWREGRATDDAQACAQSRWAGMRQCWRTWVRQMGSHRA